jgi:hypothetical protein
MHGPLTFLGLGYPSLTEAKKVWGKETGTAWVGKTGNKPSTPNGHSRK